MMTQGTQTANSHMKHMECKHKAINNRIKKKTMNKRLLPPATCALLALDLNGDMTDVVLSLDVPNDHV
jgi:hypothetical protein